MNRISYLKALLAVLFLSIHALATADSAEAYKSATRYNLAGQIVGEISSDPDGSGYLRYLATRNTYDQQYNRLVRVESGYLTSWQPNEVKPENWQGFVVLNTTEYAHDSYGRAIKKSVISGGDEVSVTQTGYSIIGTVECIAVRMNSDAFDSLPNNACDLGSEGNNGPDRITRYLHNVKGGVITEERAVGTPLEQVYLSNEYTPDFKVESVTDANGNRTEYEYDGHGRLKKTFFPSKTNYNTADTSNYEEYKYDEAGNRYYFRKRNGQVIKYEYDNLNRLIKKDLPNTTALDVYYGYTHQGEQRYARFASHSGNGVTFTYDGFGNILSEVNNTSGVSYSIQSVYDNNNNKTRIVYPDNKYFTYEYDKLNRFTSIKESGAYTVTTRVYDQFGRLDAFNRASGAHSDFEFDGVNRLRGISDNLNGDNYDVTYTFSYNPASQLTSKTLSNRDFEHAGSAAQLGSYEANGLNQYTKVNGRTLQYDGNGNLKSDSYLTFVYDSENRLISSSGTKNVSLAYDPLGRLNKQIVNGTTTYFLFDGDNLIAEYDSSRNMISRYVHGIGFDKPLFQYSGSNLSSSNRKYLHIDSRGSIILQSDHSKNATALNIYDEFGVPSNANQGRFGYTGQIWLKEIGLYYYKARIYHPKLGRFLQTDPVGYEDQMNLYAYVANDPLNFKDPTGLCRSNNGNPDNDCETVEVVEVTGQRPPDNSNTRDYIIAGLLIGGDVLLGGPSGEGIIPAMAIIGGRQALKQGVKQAAKEAIEAQAKKLGFNKRISPQKAPFNSHGQPVFSNGKKFITRDVDSHKGGVWKVFDKKGRRIGTFNEDLSIKVGK